MAPFGVQLVKDVLRRVNGTGWPARGADWPFHPPCRQACSLGDLVDGADQGEGNLTCCGECGVQGTIAAPVIDVTGAPEVPPVTALIIVTLQ